jgi:hypothetical protein
MGLGAGQRSISAALVVAGQNLGMEVVTYLMVIAVVGLAVLMPLAGELEKERHVQATLKRKPKRLRSWHGWNQSVLCDV